MKTTQRKTALVFGAGGFIGNHLVNRLKAEGYWVKGVDLKYPEFQQTKADEFLTGDLRDPYFVSRVVRAPGNDSFDELYQLAADMGGAGYIFTGEHDADVMHNSASININTAKAAYVEQIKKVFYSSSACIYPAYNQEDPDNPNCEEASAYPAAPDSEYGWEKLFSERLYLSFKRNYGLDVRIARFHNIFGPCFDDKTEVLTNNGWKLFEDLTPADKIASLDTQNNFIYQDWKVKQKYLYEGDMYAVCDRGVDQLVTPEHKVYVATRTTKVENGKQRAAATPFSLKEAKSLKWYVSTIYFTSSFNWIGCAPDKEFYLSEVHMTDGRSLHEAKTVTIDDWFEFMGWYISEGSMFQTDSNYTVVLTQYERKNSANRKKIKDVLTRMGFHFSEDKQQKQIIISNKQLFQTLVNEGITPGCENKFIPRWMLNYPKKQMIKLFDSLMAGDGNKTGKRYNTTSRRLADDFQELALKLGYSASIKKELSKSVNHADIYRIYLCQRSRFCTKRANRKKVKYSGYVYDVTLPEHHVLLVRRNGKVCWSGNCGTWQGGKEKAPAAICRKVIQATNELEIWGDGEQTRSFLYIDECIEAVRRLMNSSFTGPVNIGSDEMVTINQLVDIACTVEGKVLNKKHIPGPTGVRGRNSDNALIKQQLGWAPNYPLEKGIHHTYNWIKQQLAYA